MLLWLYTHVLSISYVFSRMFQAFQLDVSKVDLGAHVAMALVAWGTAAFRSRLLLHVAGALPWVTVRAPEQGRRLRGAHP